MGAEWTHETRPKESRSYRRVFGPMEVVRAERHDGLVPWGDRLTTWKKEPGGILSRVGTTGLRLGSVTGRDHERVVGERLAKHKPALTPPRETGGV